MFTTNNIHIHLSWEMHENKNTIVCMYIWVEAIPWKESKHDKKYINVLPNNIGH